MLTTPVDLLGETVAFLSQESHGTDKGIFQGWEDKDMGAHTSSVNNIAAHLRRVDDDKRQSTK